MTSLYDELGGDAAIDAAVNLFYTKVLADEHIKHFFDGVNMDKQRRMQKQFLTYAFGGPNNYNGRSMREAHKHLVDSKKLSDSHFDAVIKNLGDTLQELGIASDKIKEVITVAESVRVDVLCK